MSELPREPDRADAERRRRDYNTGPWAAAAVLVVAVVLASGVLG